MAIGTAGYTAMLAVMALEQHGLTPASGPVAGDRRGRRGRVGRGRDAGQARLPRCIASTGPAAGGRLSERLGATEIIDRKEFAGPAKPLAKERWAGGIDSVGSTTLANAAVDDPIWRSGRGLRPCRRHGFAASVAPFILRGVSPSRHRFRHVSA